MTATPDPRSKAAREAWLRALESTAFIDRSPGVTLPLLVERWAERGGACALTSGEATLSYRELADRCHRYAHWGLARGLRAGDTVSLLMPNCAEYLAVWLGLTRLGVTVALQNTHVSGAVLAHALRIVRPRLIIAGAALAAPLAAIRDALPGDVGCWVHGASAADLQPLEPDLAQQPAEPLRPQDCALPSLDATALYIYTSGTTGLPKAARVSHYRLMQWSHWFAGLMDTGPGDVMYDCLPLYHSVGGVVATGATLVGGDVRETRCTLFQYIGELCRYLVNAPAHPAEQDHGLRLACGNGLRPEVWEPFAARFRIPRILEYYAATEANFSLYNCEGEPGSIGRIPPYLGQQRASVALLRIDLEKGEPTRNAAGFCEPCAADEVGEAVGRIGAAGARAGRFEGYAGTEAADKVLRGVFAEGDAWYRTGDLMRRDARGFFYFVDRLGDTYRWKGENVSTAEVMAVMSTLPGVREAVVYGVAIPGTDGRAGMAALRVDEEFDLATCRAAVVQRLPAYARPVFLRLLPAVEATATFKPIKTELLRGGFDPRAVADPLYFDSAGAGAYLPLDTALHAAIVGGALRL
jgi:fatty-acyl-CoA synthase